jgi:hypothetical protein
MLDKQVLRIEERLLGHRSFLPQEIIQRRSMDWGFSEKAQLQPMISMEGDVVDYLSERMDVVYFSTAICGLESKKSKQSRDFCCT